VKKRTSKQGEKSVFDMESVASTLFNVNDLPGHAAYLLLAVSYFLTSMYWLRLFAILGLLLEIIYFSLTGGNLFAGMLWTIVFITINAYQLFWLIREKLSLRLPEKEGPLLRASLSGLSDAQISKLLQAADWKDFQQGETLTRQDAPVDALYFLCSGRANVEVNKSLVTYLEQGSFVGEIAYLTGNPATATVVIDEPARVLKFSKMRMAKVTAADPEINGIIYQLLGRDLAMKMRRANTRRVLQEEENLRV
jgi:CRP-like cAMP-binding protein